MKGWKEGSKEEGGKEGRKKRRQAGRKGSEITFFPKVAVLECTEMTKPN